MSAKMSHRGRPKGTGIDDSAMLAAIDGQIAANPEMRPTTAIKSLGVEDPSAIRRLRDKYKCLKNGALPLNQPVPKHGENLPKQTYSSEPISAHSMALSGPRDAVRKSRRSSKHPLSSGTKAIPDGQRDATIPVAASAEHFNLFVNCMAASANAFNQVAKHQAIWIREWTENPIVKFWFQHQVLCAETYLKTSHYTRKAFFSGVNRNL